MELINQLKEIRKNFVKEIENQKSLKDYLPKIEREKLEQAIKKFWECDKEVFYLIEYASTNKLKRLWLRITKGRPKIWPNTIGLWEIHLHAIKSYLNLAESLKDGQNQ